MKGGLADRLGRGSLELPMRGLAVLTEGRL